MNNSMVDNMKPVETEYHRTTDEQLCARVAAGDRGAEEALVLRHTRLVRMCARPFFLAGGDSEDLIQEGMLGLLAAIREFRPDRGARFATYAQVCIRRRIISAVRAAAGGKHAPLNDYVSLEPSLLLADLEPSAPSNPEDVVIHQEALRALESAIASRLTPLEGQQWAGLPNRWITPSSASGAKWRGTCPKATPAKADRKYMPLHQPPGSQCQREG